MVENLKTSFYLSPSCRFNSFTSLFKSAKQSFKPVSLGLLGTNCRRSFNAASSISDWIDPGLDCCIKTWYGEMLRLFFWGVTRIPSIHGCG